MQNYINITNKNVTMKKIKFITIAIVAIGLSSMLTSCKKKSAEPETSQSQTSPSQTAQSVVGTWDWTDLKDSIPGYPIQLYTITTSTVTGKTITFNSSGTFTSGRNFSQIGNPNNLSPDNGTYTNTDSLIITSVVASTPVRLPVRAKVLSVTANNLSFVYETGGKYHTCYFTKQ